MQTCPDCGARNEDGELFCGACGTYLEWEEQRSASASTSATAELTEEEDVTSPEVEQVTEPVAEPPVDAEPAADAAPGGAPEDGGAGVPGAHAPTQAGAPTEASSAVEQGKDSGEQTSVPTAGSPEASDPEQEAAAEPGAPSADSKARREGRWALRKAKEAATRAAAVAAPSVVKTAAVAQPTVQRAAAKRAQSKQAREEAAKEPAPPGASPVDAAATSAAPAKEQAAPPKRAQRTPSPTKPTATAPAPVKPSATSPKPVKPAAMPAPVKPAAARPRRYVPPTARDEPPPAPGDLICGACGAGNAPHRNFCRRCGASLADAPTQGRDGWWRRWRSRRKARKEGPKAGTRPKRRRRRRFPVKTVVLLVVLGLLAGAGWQYRDELRTGYNTVLDRVSGNQPVNPSEVTASSSAADHGPELARDGISDRYWAPEVPGDGAGEWLQFEFAEPFRLVTVLLTSGASTEDETRLQEARPSRVRFTVTTSDGQEQITDMDIVDTGTPQALALPVSDVVTLRMTILAAYGATDDSHVAVAEVEFRGR